VAAFDALRPAGADTLSAVVAPLVALLFLLATTALLVLDLKRPDRFHYILFKGNPRSWLVWGAWILLAYGAVAALWLAAGVTGQAGVLRALALPAIALAAAAAGYSAFLFGQAEGRDFWQSPLHLPHLLAGAVVAGSAVLLVLRVLIGDAEASGIEDLRRLMTLGLLAHVVLVMLDLFGPHSSVDVRRAARLVTHGAWRVPFLGGVLAAGVVTPLALMLVPTPPATSLAALLALAGLWMYEDLWIKAGQSVPLS
jgi:formate-dependent nitrite reductase membrane component NrfD